jgi:ADP-ribose pyrophosphatase YjhB (NUDIX family)
MSHDLLFQYCPKVAVFRDDTLLLCKRRGEADYDGVFSLIGGKLEHKDKSIIDGIRREVGEEVGSDLRLSVLTRLSLNTMFQKRDGNAMILPHYYARYVGGEITLNDEYSEYAWARLSELGTFSPMIENIRWIAPTLRRFAAAATPDDFDDV